jgi:hypothetical protein
MLGNSAMFTDAAEERRTNYGSIVANYNSPLYMYRRKVLSSSSFFTEFPPPPQRKPSIEKPNRSLCSLKRLDSMARKKISAIGECTE